jgi:hypothetical protein
MISAKFDTREFDKKLKNTVAYSQGFFDGVEMEKSSFNRFLGGVIAEALVKYIDAKARMNPQALHHVYEPGAVGSESSRLFSFSVITSTNYIRFEGKFLPSKGVPLSGGDPFVDKANIMENSISIVIEPRNADVLAFEDDGETVFSVNSIVIDHPGGDAVAGSFGNVVGDFFDNYMRNGLLLPIFNNLRSAKEFTESFSSGSLGGRMIGVRAGRKYLKSKEDLVNVI